MGPKYRNGQEVCVSVKILEHEGPSVFGGDYYSAEFPNNVGIWMVHDLDIRHAAPTPVPSEPSTDYCRGYAEGQHHAKARPHGHIDYTRIPDPITADYRAGYLRGFRECLDLAAGQLNGLPDRTIESTLRF